MYTHAPITCNFDVNHGPGGKFRTIEISILSDYAGVHGTVARSSYEGKFLHATSLMHYEYCELLGQQILTPYKTPDYRNLSARQRACVCTWFFSRQ